MVAVLGREEGEIPAVEPDAVEVNEVRVASLLPSDAEEVELAILLVDTQQLGDVPLAFGDLVLELAGLGIVEVEMSPVVALAEPEELPGLRQVIPVDAAVAAFKEGGDFFLQDVAHHAGGGVGNAQHFLFMIARGGDKSESGTFLIPLDVGPFAAAAGDVVAQGGAVLVGRQVEAHDARAIEIDGDALDGGDHFVAGQRVLPRLERGVADLGFHQVHFADAALILLEGGDAFGIRRPQQDGPIAAGPSGVVGGVAEILDTVGCERRLPIGGGIAYP